jgi:hypothetical protein
MVQGKPLVPVQWDIEKYLSQAETDLAWDKAGLAQAKADTVGSKTVAMFGSFEVVAM